MQFPQTAFLHQTCEAVRRRIFRRVCRPSGARVPSLQRNCVFPQEKIRVRRKRHTTHSGTSKRPSENGVFRRPFAPRGLCRYNRARPWGSSRPRGFQQPPESVPTQSPPLRAWFRQLRNRLPNGETGKT
ncbi:hypothetical protein [Kingella potus]|uniref:hypothetical protein n=1 Tax=Kingella potus TaxID=265175 RepID=UPI001FD02DEF|nr:hypothetical protein [Kingella potus]UOP00911.1 hypothetical protein LVJ84_00320 [Kingella potus]